MVSKFRHELWMRLGEHRAALPLFKFYGRLTGRTLAVVDRKTDIVIEGYPRSGNTFTVVALQTIQPRPIRIAHHVHGVGQLHAAARWGIPAILLVRDPLDAVASLVVRYPDIPVETALDNYVRFYGRLGTYLPEVVVIPFELLITDFSIVVQAVNQRFDTRFAGKRIDRALEEELFGKIEELDRRDRRARRHDERTIARPSQTRGPELRAARQVIREPRHADLLSQAIGLRRTLIDHSGFSRQGSL